MISKVGYGDMHVITFISEHCEAECDKVSVEVSNDELYHIIKQCITQIDFSDFKCSDLKKLRKMIFDKFIDADREYNEGN